MVIVWLRASDAKDVVSDTTDVMYSLYLGKPLTVDQTWIVKRFRPHWLMIEHRTQSILGCTGDVSAAA